MTAVKKIYQAVEPAVIKQDRILRKLIDLHVSKHSAHSKLTAANLALNPVLITGYKDLYKIRYDFPAVLVDNQPDKFVESLSVIIDRLLEQMPTDENGTERLSKDVYKLEAAIKKLAEQTSGKRLSELWTLASESLLETSIHNDIDKQALRNNLRNTLRVLKDDGIVISCEKETPTNLFTHAWNLLQKEQTSSLAKLLDTLINGMTDIQRADRAKSSKERRPSALRAAMGKQESIGIDFKAMSAILQNRGRGRRLSKKRRDRIHSVLSVLQSAQQFFALPEAETTSDENQDRFSFYCENCSEALEKFALIQQQVVDLFKSIRIAALEMDNQYYSAQHDAFFEDFTADDLTAAEYRSFPPFLVCLHSSDFGAIDKTALIQILSSNLPIKVLLSVDQLEEDSELESGLNLCGGWNSQLATMALSLNNAFVLQTASSHLVKMADEVIAGLNYNGPALFSVYSGSLPNYSHCPHYLACAAAVESRAFTEFVYNPTKGSDWASRFSLDYNPNPERDWTEHNFCYEDAEGQAITETLSFTFIDFISIDPAFANYFVVVPKTDWHDNMLPVDEYLQVARGDTPGWIPYILMVDANNILHRVVVKRSLLASARKCLANWNNLQELGGIANSHVLKSLETEKQRQQEEKQSQAEAAEIVQPAGSEQLPATERETADTAKSPTDTVAEEEAGTSPDDAYIETARCTSCNDCTDRNGRMFSYDEAKQAYIKDISAGTFRELVEAAENCPICIIHPGQPTNPDEPGLDELVTRAEVLN